MNTEFSADVLRAMTKWPDVPNCYGWLSLDQRGRWLLQGEVIKHRRACHFLGQHYASDDAGNWFVQNGPQRVFVALTYTPWVLRVQPDQSFTTHTGRRIKSIQNVYADDEGQLLLNTELGVGLIDDRDLVAVSEMLNTESEPMVLTLKQETYAVAAIERNKVAARFGFVVTPQADKTP